MKTTELFKQTIKAYLDKRAAEDQLFAAAYAKENKTLDKCIAYIFNEVKVSGCNGFTDEEIYSMAVHYYDEDNIEVDNMPKCEVIVNHKVELTDEEKARAREDAIRAYQEEEIRKMRERDHKPKAQKESKNVQQLSLF